MQQLDYILQRAFDLKASDTHLSTGYSVAYRLKGEIKMENEYVLTNEDVKNYAQQILKANNLDISVEEIDSYDCSYFFNDDFRFRINIYKQLNGYSIAARLIEGDYKNKITIDMPEILKKMANKKSGLFLVVGPTGSGKSTTATYFLDLINQNKRARIITVEDPVEYIHKPKKSMFEQRNVGDNVKSFAEGLRSALRQDPDVIFVGEMRDEETIEIALTAAETGHLVISTLHTDNAPNTIMRIVDAFPAEKQKQVRSQLASSLLGIMAQTLRPNVYHEKMILLSEIMINNNAIANKIRTDNIHQISSSLETGINEGMYTFEQNAQKLYKEGIINDEVLNEFTNKGGR